MANSGVRCRIRRGYRNPVGTSQNTFAFIRFSSELETAYVDTLGDMALGLSGSVLAGLAAALAPHRQRT